MFLYSVVVTLFTINNKGTRLGFYSISCGVLQFLVLNVLFVQCFAWQHVKMYG